MLEIRRVLPALVLAMSILTSVYFVETVADTCNAFLYPGSGDVDIKIAAIYGMHASNGSSCSERPRVAPVQIAIAMQWAASLLNGDNSTQSFVPGVKIGVDIYDDCNQEYLAAKHTGTVASLNIGNSVGQCTVGGQNSQDQALPIAGIIGTTRSQTTTLVTNIARLSNIPVVGIAATLAELSDKTKYPGFTRATPNDHLQAKAIIDLALKFKWSYIVGIFTSDNYGQMGMERLQSLAADHRICISVVMSLDCLGGTWNENALRDTLFEKVKSSNNALGVIYFGQNEGLVRLLDLFQEWSKNWLGAKDKLRRIHWMVSDGVALDGDLIRLIKPYDTSVVGVDMVTSEIASFRDFQRGFLMSPPTWAREGRWRLALETLAKEHFGCTSYNISDDTGQAGVDCNLDDSSDFSGYLTTSVDAVYLLANTLKIMHSSLCPGQEGVCDSLREKLEEGMLASHNLSMVDYTTMDPAHVPAEFISTSRALEPSGGDFSVRNQSLYVLKANDGNHFEQIGSYSADGVEILPAFQGREIVPASECSQVCKECHDLGLTNYEFVDGDYVILGIFSLHWKAVDVPFKCGAFRTDSYSFPAMKAFTHAVQRLKGETGINFGYLAVDDCYSPLTINKLLSKIMSGDLEVVCKFTHATLDPKKIVVAVGAQSSPVTIAVLPTLQNLNIPLISYSATNPSLDNRITYPYFSRTVISDTQQASAISLILQQLNVTYVGAIVFGNTYGRALYQAFREKAEALGICVDDAIEVTEETTASDLKPHLKHYWETQVNVIVAFIMDQVAVTLTDAIEHKDTFVFIGSEAWGRQYEVIDGDRGERVRGSLILEPMGFNVDYGFKNYMQSWSMSETQRNDWLRKFWEGYFDCNLPRGFNNIHQTSCRGNFSTASIDEFEEAPLIMHASVATIAAGVAVKNLIGDITRKPEDVLPLDPEALTERIRDVTLTASDGTSFKPFCFSGNGNNGFRVFNVQQVGPKKIYNYEEVGTFRNEKLTLDHNKLRFYDIVGQVVTFVESSCLYKTECDQICKTSQATVVPQKPTTKPKPSEEDDDDDGPDLVVIILAVVVGVLFIFIVVIILLAVLTCCGRIKWSRPGKSSKSNMASASYYHESSISGPERSYNQSRESHSSSSFAASAVSHRPPLPSRNRKDMISQERADPSYSNKAFSDIIATQSGGPARDSDNVCNRSRSASVDEMRKLDTVRAIPLRYRFHGVDATSQAYSSSDLSTRDQSDNSSHLNKSIDRGVQINDPQHHQLEELQQQVLHSMAVGQHHINHQTMPMQTRRSQPNQQHLNQMERALHPSRNLRFQHEELRHQQQLIILQELQNPDLDESIRQQYLALLYKTERLNEPSHQPQVSDLQQAHIDDQHDQKPHHYLNQPHQTRKPEVVLSEAGRAVYFSNVTDANAIYSLPQSSPSYILPSAKNPEYVYVLTAEGVAVPYENYARLQKPRVMGDTKASDWQTLQNTYNSRDAQSYPNDASLSHATQFIGKHPIQSMPDGSVVRDKFQSADQPSNGQRTVEYAHISSLKKGEALSHPYLVLEEKTPGERNTKRDVGREYDIHLQGQDLSIPQHLPSPHSKKMASDYLTPLPDSGSETVYDVGPGIPAVVELPREIFFPPEDQVATWREQTPAKIIDQGVNVRSDFPIAQNATETSTPQIRATTYTVSSSDYPVKINQTRMSSVPYYTPQRTEELPDTNKAYSVKTNQTNRNTSDFKDSTTPSTSTNVDTDKVSKTKALSSKSTELGWNFQYGNASRADSETDTTWPMEDTEEVFNDRMNAANNSNGVENSNNNDFIENNNNHHTNVVVPGTKHVHGAGLAFPQHPDILENLMEGDQSMTEV